MINTYHDSLILKRNTDSYGNPISLNIVDIKPVMDNHSCVVLTQLPDESYGIEVEGFTEVYDTDHIGALNYKVDYPNGVVYFNPLNIGRPVTIDYKGIGCELIYCSRVASKLDSAGNVVETLEEMIEKGKNYLALIDTLGNSVTVINKLEENIDEATTLYDLLHYDINIAKPLQESLHNDINEAKKFNEKLSEDVAEGKVIVGELDRNINTGSSVNKKLESNINIANSSISKIDAAGNVSVKVLPSDWIGGVDGGFTYALTHNLKSENLQVNMLESNNGILSSSTPVYDIVDANSIILKADERKEVKVVLSASYYCGGADIVDEVVAARGTKKSLDERIRDVLIHEEFSDEGISIRLPNIQDDINNIKHKYDGIVEINLENELYEGEATYDEAFKRAFLKLDKGGRLLLPNKTIDINDSLVWDLDNVEVVGCGSSSILSFQCGGLIIGSTKQVNRCTFRNFRITSKSKTGKALCLNSSKTIDKPVTDTVFRDIHISGHSVGIEMSHSWCLQFDNVRVQGCATSLISESQTNNVIFNKCNFVGWSNIGQIVNNLGVSFNECSFENGSVRFANIYQSYVTFTAPYIEFISDYFVEIASSSLTMNGGYGLETLKVADSNCSVVINNSNQDNKEIFVDTSVVRGIRNISINSLNTSKAINNTIYECRGNISQDANIELNRDGYFSYNGTSRLFLVTNKTLFENGKRYTITYTARSKGTGLFFVKGESSDQLPITDKFETWYTFFEYKDNEDISLSFVNAGGIDVKQVAIYEGIYTLPFIQDTNKVLYEGYALQPPTTGSWMKGDRIKNSNPSVGNPKGWICTANGTAGTWVSEGNL